MREGGSSAAAGRPPWLAAPRTTPARATAWFVAVLLDRSGLLAHWLRRRARRGEGAVLLFHRVVTPPERLASQPGIAVSAERFEEMLVCLSRHPVLALVPDAEILDRSGTADGRAPHFPVAITFDDGWRDTEEVALPILAAHRAPATLFVAAGYVGTDRLFWPERVLRSYAVRETRERARHARAHLGLREDADAETFISRLKEIDEREREALLAAIGAPRTADPAPLLSWDGVRRLRAAGVRIGSHGLEHRILTRIPLEEAEVDLRAARERIAAETGEAPEALAYPNGDASVDVARAARRAGYRRAFVVAPVAAGVAAPGLPGDAPSVGGEARDPFLVPRRNVHEATGAAPFGRFSRSLFLCEALGAFEAPRRALEAARRARLLSTAALVALLLALLAPIAGALAGVWGASPSAAHGLLVPPAALYLAWRRRAALAAAVHSEPGGRPGSWLGLSFLAAALGGAFLATAGSSQTGQFVALVLAVWGVVWARLGARATRVLAVPLLLLLLAVPVPFGLEVLVSIPLRHAASVIGVTLARAVGTPAILDGNVIHLAEASLNVDDACSGLRSLVSLLVVGTIYLGVASVPARRALLLALALVPIAVAANALRLLGTIVLVRLGGPTLAAGAAHTATGAATFGVALGALFLLERRLRWRGSSRRPGSSSSS